MLEVYWLVILIKWLITECNPLEMAWVLHCEHNGPAHNEACCHNAVHTIIFFFIYLKMWLITSFSSLLVSAAVIRRPSQTPLSVATRVRLLFLTLHTQFYHLIILGISKTIGPFWQRKTKANFISFLPSCYFYKLSLAALIWQIKVKLSSWFADLKGFKYALAGCTHNTVLIDWS